MAAAATTCSPGSPINWSGVRTCSVRPMTFPAWPASSARCASVGGSCLLAGRLVEAGVPLVQVNWPWGESKELGVSTMWDTHQKLVYRHKNVLMPPLDEAFSALLEDLAARGLLDQTLVVCTGEMGRTPKM